MSIRLAALALIFSFLPLLSAYAQILAPERNNLRYACEASGEISGSEVDERWCQCMNDYYLDKMTPADWLKYGKDYYALQKLLEVQSEAYSYTRELQVGRGHCIDCKKNGYRGCLKSGDRLVAYEDLIENLTTGQFRSIEKNMTYKVFYTDFIRSYSKQCSAYIRDGVVDTYIYDDPVIGTGGSTTRIESKFLKSYDRYVKDVKLNGMAEITRKSVEALEKQNPLLLLEIGFDVVSRDTFLNQKFSGQCTSPQVRALHANLERFDKGLTPLSTLATTRAPASEAEKKRAEIFAYTKASYDKAVAAYAPTREKYAPVSCPRRQEQATQVSVPRSPGGDNLKDLEGAWTGTFYGEPMELAFWHIQHMPDTNPIVLGYIYLPERQCSLTMDVAPYGTPAKAVVRARSNYRHPSDCQNVTPPETSREQYGFNGDFAFDDGTPVFMLTEIQSSLKEQASCSAPDPAFTRTKPSPAFRKVIEDIQSVKDPNTVMPTPQQVAKMMR